MSIFQKIENKDEWGGLLSKVSFKTFFHTLEWEGFLEKEFSWLKFERYEWKDELLLSIARCRLLGKEKLVSHPLCEYGGPLPLKDKVDWENFFQDSERFFGNRAKIKPHPYLLQNYRGLTPTLSGSDPGILTFWIENFSKKSPEDLWNNFRKTLKQEIKKGEGFVKISECQGESELSKFYGIYLRTVKRHKNIPLPFSVFKFFVTDCGGSVPPREEGQTLRKGARVFVAKKDKHIIGGSIFLLYPPFIHYFISASDEGFRDWNIGHKILWHVMQKYVGGRLPPHIKYDYFDLGGTRKGSALEVFKRGWGAREYPIYEFGETTTRSGNSLFRNLLGFAPTMLTLRVAKFALWIKV